MQTNRAKPIGGSVSVRGKPGIGQAFFFAKGNNTNTAASQLSQKVSFQGSTGQSQHNEFAAPDYDRVISANVRSRSVSRSITPSRATSTSLRVTLSLSS